MKRVLVFLILWIASMGLGFAADCNTIILPSSYLKKTDNCILYSQNLEEIFANDIIQNSVCSKKTSIPPIATIKHVLKSNPQLNSGLDTPEKLMILAKIHNADKIINITVKYEIQTMDNLRNNKRLEQLGLISDNSTLRLITKVDIINAVDNRVVWNNVYFKRFNLEQINNKTLSPITEYYKNLALKSIEESKTQSSIRPVSNKQPQEPIKIHETPKSETVEIPHITPATNKNTSIKPQLQLQENITDKKPVAKRQKKAKQPVTKDKSESKGLQIKLKPSTPQKTLKPEDIKTNTKPVVQPTYTNIHVTPRKNSRDYSPKFKNMVNDI